MWARRSGSPTARPDRPPWQTRPNVTTHGLGHTDPPVHARFLTYDLGDRLVAEADPLGGVWRFAYMPGAWSKGKRPVM
jgi:YD repeat-containing protein